MCELRLRLSRELAPSSPSVLREFSVIQKILNVQLAYFYWIFFIFLSENIRQVDLQDASVFPKIPFSFEPLRRGQRSTKVPTRLDLRVFGSAVAALDLYLRPLRWSDGSVTGRPAGAAPPAGVRTCCALVLSVLNLEKATTRLCRRPLDPSPPPNGSDAALAGRLMGPRRSAALGGFSFLFFCCADGKPSPPAHLSAFICQIASCCL